ncbi:hypothetical protein G9A89_013716 [Geosiphon pyriformis]|nr:hypothetical protein G9A89_013716 [Geosiphon pyriformis]
MSLLNDPEYLVHNLRIGYLRRVDDPYATQIISFSPTVLSNDYIKIAASSYPEMQECHSPNTSMLLSSSGDYFDLRPSGNGAGVSPISTINSAGGKRTRGLTNQNNQNGSRGRRSDPLSGQNTRDSDGSRTVNGETADSDDGTDPEVEDNNRPHRHSFAKLNITHPPTKTPPPVVITSPSKPPRSRPTSRNPHLVGISYSPPLAALKTSPDSIIGLSSTEQTPILSPNSSPELDKEIINDRRGSEASMLTADEGIELPPDTPPPRAKLSEVEEKEFIPEAPKFIRRPKAFSALSTLIENQKTKSRNPFSEDYSFFAGKGELNPMKLKIFFPFSSEPLRPLVLTVKREATVEEVIGYALYQYWEEKREPTLDERVCSVVHWNMKIVEDDGEIDEDFPALDRTSKISKFLFNQYGLCEAPPDQVISNQQLQKTRLPPKEVLSTPPVSKPNRDTSVPVSTKTDTIVNTNGIIPIVAAPAPVDLSNQVFLRVRLTPYSDSEVAHTTTINVMGEQRLYDVLENVCRKRKLASKEYTFKGTEKNLYLDLEKTVDSLGVNPELALVKKPPNGFRMPSKQSRKTLEEPIYVSSTEYMSVYQKYTVNRKMPMFVGRHERSLAIDGDYIHIMPSESRTMFDSMKTSSYHISSVASCKLTKKVPTNFKLIIYRDSGNKTYDFEAADSKQAAEICTKFFSLRVPVNKRVGFKTIFTRRTMQNYVFNQSTRPGRPERIERGGDRQNRLDRQEIIKEAEQGPITELAPREDFLILKSGYLTILELRPLFRGFDLRCIILEQLSKRCTQGGQEMYHFRVADHTAVCTLVVWEEGSCLKSGDVLKINNGKVRLYNGKLELTPVKNVGKVRRYDQYCLKFVENEKPNLSMFNWIKDVKDETDKNFIAVYGPNMTPFFPKDREARQQVPLPSFSTSQRTPGAMQPQRQAPIGSTHQLIHEARPRPPLRQGSSRRDSYRGNNDRSRGDHDYDRRDFDRSSGRDFERKSFVHRDLDKPEEDDGMQFGSSSGNMRNQQSRKKQRFE